MLVDSKLVPSLPVNDFRIDRAGYAYFIWRKETTTPHGLVIRWSAPVRVHSWILPVRSDLVVDHINRNKLDNRRSNLRYASKGANVQNCGPRGQSKFKGVSLTPSGRSFIVNVGNRGCHFKACYKDELVAAKVYDREVVRVYGSSAFLNFPDEDNSGYVEPKGMLASRKSVSGHKFVYPDNRFDPPRWVVQRDRQTFGTFKTLEAALCFKKELWQ